MVATRHMFCITDRDFVSRGVERRSWHQVGGSSHHAARYGIMSCLYFSQLDPRCTRGALFSEGETPSSPRRPPPSATAREEPVVRLGQVPRERTPSAKRAEADLREEGGGGVALRTWMVMEGVAIPTRAAFRSCRSKG